MKILHITTNLGAGGAEKLIYDMAPLMKNKGNNVKVVSLSPENDVYSEGLRENGVEVIFNNEDIKSPKHICKLVKQIKGADIVYTHTYYAQLWVAFASLFSPKKTKFITTEHSSHNRRRDIKLFYYADKWMYSRFDKIISITDKVEEKLLKHLKEKKSERYVVIENGINLKHIKKAISLQRIALNYRDEDKLLIMVARFSEAKDQNTLIQAMKLLPVHYKLLLVGEGNLMDNHKKLAEELNVSDRVDFLGFRRDIPELLKMCDVGVLSSHWEGFGLAAVEAMATSIPVIASDVEGVSEVVSGAGILFKKGDKMQLKEEIEKLCEDAVYYQKITKKCQQRAEQYDIEKMLDGYLGVIDEK